MLLQKSDCDVNATGRANVTPLHLAAGMNRVNVCKMLVGFPLLSGLPQSGKSQGKTKLFQGRGILQKVGKILVLVKVSENSGNFV